MSTLTPKRIICWSTDLLVCTNMIVHAPDHEVSKYLIGKAVFIVVWKKIIEVCHNITRFVPLNCTTMEALSLSVLQQHTKFGQN